MAVRAFRTLAPRLALPVAARARPAASVLPRWAVPRLATPARPSIQSRSLHRSASVFDADSGKEALLSCLEEEIRDEEENGEPPVLDATWNGFEITTSDLSSLVTMTRKTGGATVKITLNLNECELVEGEESDEGDEEPPAPLPTFLVEVEKKNATLVCECTVTDDELQLDRLGIRPAGVEENADVYFTDCGFLDEALYESIQEYLESFGIDKEFAEFIQGYAADTEYHNYLQLLQAMRSFAKAKA